MLVTAAPRRGKSLCFQERGLLDEEVPNGSGHADLTSRLQLLQVAQFFFVFFSSCSFLQDVPGKLRPETHGRLEMSAVKRDGVARVMTLASSRHVAAPGHTSVFTDQSGVQHRAQTSCTCSRSHWRSLTVHHGTVESATWRNSLAQSVSSGSQSAAGCKIKPSSPPPTANW